MRGRRRRLPSGRARRPSRACGDHSSTSECHLRRPYRSMSSSRSNRPHRQSKASRLCRRAPRRPGRCRLSPLRRSRPCTICPSRISSPRPDQLVVLGDQPDEIRPSWGLSTVFGAAIVAAGGYPLRCGCSIASEGAGFRPGRKPIAPGDDGSGDRPAENLLEAQCSQSLGDTRVRAPPPPAGESETRCLIGPPRSGMPRARAGPVGRQDS